LVRVSAPTLVLDGGQSPQWMRDVARRIADAVPGAAHETLDGQTHDVDPRALVEPLGRFFTA
jgi:folylpolyglutamate synthase/dihydropteroate synthase